MTDMSASQIQETLAPLVGATITATMMDEVASTLFVRLADGSHAAVRCQHDSEDNPGPGPAVWYGVPTLVGSDGGPFDLSFLAEDNMTITAVRAKIEPADEYTPEQAWPCITVRASNGEEYEIEGSRDEEGNGPAYVRVVFA